MLRALKKFRANIGIVLADKDAFMRQGLRNALAAEGYRNIRAYGRVSSLREHIAATMPDLVILDSDTPGGDAIELVSAIRRNELGKNPFLPVILAIWDSDAVTVTRAANSGADVILMKPFSPAQLFSRIERLVVGRKPFVATDHYTGPDRRGHNVSRTVRRFDVPNTLKDKLEGQPADPAALVERIESTVRQINDGRLEQMTVKLAHHVEAACAALEREADHKGADKALSQVIRTAERIRSSATDQLTRLCAALITIAEALLGDTNTDVGRKQLVLLRRLSQSAVLAANPDMNASAAIADITRVIEGYAQDKPNPTGHQRPTASKTVPAPTLPETGSRSNAGSA